MLKTDKSSQAGLTNAEVIARRQKYGENRLLAVNIAGDVLLSVILINIKCVLLKSIFH